MQSACFFGFIGRKGSVFFESGRFFGFVCREVLAILHSDEKKDTMERVNGRMDALFKVR